MSDTTTTYTVETPLGTYTVEIIDANTHGWYARVSGPHRVEGLGLHKSKHAATEWAMVAMMAMHDIARSYNTGGL